MPFIVLDPTAAAAAPAITIGAPRTSEGKTLAMMRAELRTMLLGRNDTGVDDSKLNGWINDAYLDVCSTLEIDELQTSFSLTTVVGKALYLLPSGVYSLESASLVDASLPQGGHPLGKIDKREYRASEDLNDWPKAFFREGNMLVLWPTPDKAYSLTVDARIRPQRLVEETDSPFLDEEWHRSIVLKARQFALDDLQEFDKALVAENSATRSLQQRENRTAAEDAGRVVRSSVPGRGDRYRNTHRFQRERA